jgi:hypothetical protein
VGGNSRLGLPIVPVKVAISPYPGEDLGTPLPGALGVAANESTVLFVSVMTMELPAV